LNKNKIKIIIV